MGSVELALASPLTFSIKLAIAPSDFLDTELAIASPDVRSIELEIEPRAAQAIVLDFELPDIHAIDITIEPPRTRGRVFIRFAPVALGDAADYALNRGLAHGPRPTIRSRSSVFSPAGQTQLGCSGTRTRFAARRLSGRKEALPVSTRRHPVPRQTRRGSA